MGFAECHGDVSLCFSRGGVKALPSPSISPLILSPRVSEVLVTAAGRAHWGGEREKGISKSPKWLQNIPILLSWWQRTQRSPASGGMRTAVERGMMVTRDEGLQTYRGMMITVGLGASHRDHSEPNLQRAWAGDSCIVGSLTPGLQEGSRGISLSSATFYP